MFFCCCYVGLMGDQGDLLCEKSKNKNGFYHEAVEPFITMFGLSSLLNLSYEYADHGLLDLIS